MVNFAASRRHRRGGFTLIELLVVLAIIGMLLTLVVPRLYQHVDHARETVLADNLRTIRAVLDKFYADKNRYPNSLDELVQEKYIAALPIDPVAKSTHWQVVPPPAGLAGEVYDIHSTAEGVDGAGKAYADW